MVVELLATTVVCGVAGGVCASVARGGSAIVTAIGREVFFNHDHMEVGIQKQVVTP
jgi:hypothetical protein